jgi:hypothetical protein
MEKGAGTIRSRSDGDGSKPRTRRISRIIRPSDPTATFSENIHLDSELGMSHDNQDDHVRLVDANNPCHEIKVTHQVTQVTEVANGNDLEKQKIEDAISPAAWKSRSPPS